MTDFVSQAEALQSEIVAWRRHIHENAEIGNVLPNTAAYVGSVLKSLNIPFCHITKSGIAATIGHGERTILLRADMDALPGREGSGLPFASTNGAVHSCGHDIHTAMLLGTAKLLKQIEDQLAGRVVLMFQPGEECMTGALDMIEHGLLDRFSPQLALAMHVNVGDVPPGSVWIKQGTFNAASDIFEVKVSGKGGHGAHPQNAINPISAMLPIMTAFEEISRYEIAPLQPNVLTVCAIEAGSAGNVIPQSGVFRGTLRTLDEKARETILRRLEETSGEIARAYRCTSEFRLLSGTPVLENRKDISDWAEAKLVELLGRERVKTPVIPSMGSEDFSQIASRVPSCYMSIGIPRAPGCTVPLHNENIVFEETNLFLGTAVFAHLAYSFTNGAFLPLTAAIK